MATTTRSKRMVPRLYTAAALLLAGCGPPSTSLVVETTRGAIRCEVDAARSAPIARLAREHYYDGLLFFRAVPGVLVQTGSRTNDGANPPELRWRVAAGDDDVARLAAPGAIMLARYTPPPGRVDPHPPSEGRVIGAELVIALTDMHHLAGSVTVLGTCRDLDIVANIATDVAAGHPVNVVRVTAR